jgi:hypothetical protein
MSAIQWPGVIKLSQSDEMHYIANEQQWRAFQGNHLSIPEDTLIDSQGHLYCLNGSRLTEDHRACPPVALGEFIHLVQLHAQSLNQCCSAKIGFKTLAQGLALVQYLTEQDT